ncbi:MAG: hypothetical protein AUF79_17470 [Crenarchaeota archaeon 13_1_20CM_2_51_8]|nr:MAG: hypothetical protein AUF79_17470 [Crenarchaeota archaeon 13_1_20CM_2_51_8]
MPREGKTVAKSFRVNEKALSALQEEAARQSVSVNTLVNQLLLDYSEFGRFLQRVNAIRLSRKTFGEILNSVSDDSLIKAGQVAGKSAPMALIASKWGKITVNTVIEYIHDLSAYANLFEYYEKNENERWTITLMHELGPKWSTFLTQYIGEAFAAAGVQPKTKTSDRAVIFNF